MLPSLCNLSSNTDASEFLGATPYGKVFAQHKVNIQFAREEVESRHCGRRDKFPRLAGTTRTVSRKRQHAIPFRGYISSHYHDITCHRICTCLYRMMGPEHTKNATNKDSYRPTRPTSCLHTPGMLLTFSSTPSSSSVASRPPARACVWRERYDERFRTTRSWLATWTRGRLSSVEARRCVSR